MGAPALDVEGDAVLAEARLPPHEVRVGVRVRVRGRVGVRGRLRLTFHHARRSAAGSARASATWSGEMWGDMG